VQYTSIDFNHQSIAVVPGGLRAVSDIVEDAAPERAAADCDYEQSPICAAFWAY
jgi:hypothetical protein